jgi:hypothetical protein
VAGERASVKFVNTVKSALRSKNSARRQRGMGYGNAEVRRKGDKPSLASATLAECCAYSHAVLDFGTEAETRRE